MKGLKNAVLVTGCSGYIGGNLCETLYQCGYNVIGVDIMVGKAPQRPIEWTTLHSTGNWDEYRVDLTKRDEVINFISELQHNGVTVNFIINLAGKTSIPDAVKDPVDTVGTNLLITYNVMLMVSRLNPQRFINANSCTYRCEDHDWNAYSWSKLASRKIIQSSSLFAETVFIDMIITNPIGSLPYYANRRKSQSLEYNLMQSIMNGVPMRVSTENDGERDEAYKRNFITIYELLGAFMYAMTYNITCDTKVFCGVIYQNKFKQYPLSELCEYCGLQHSFQIEYRACESTGFTSIKDIDSPLIPEPDIMNYYLDNIPHEVFAFKDKIKSLAKVEELLQDREKIADNEFRYELLLNTLLVNTNHADTV